MPLLIRPNAEPFSPRARPGRQNIEPILAQSNGGRLLKQELRRYCNGEVRGRSFLIAGHRGSGKTTLVDDALLRFQVEAAAGQLLMKPLPVYLLGPTLLEEEDEDAAFARSVSEQPKPDPAPPQPPALTVSLINNNAATNPPPPSASEDDLMHRVLIQVVLGLHQAVAKQFVDRFHEQARIPDRPPPEIDELCAIAAQFEIELTEAPPPSRLHEFWQLSGRLRDGILFDSVVPWRVRHGMRELVALTGVTHAHQRVSGELREQDDQRTGRSRSTEVATGYESKTVEMLKPLLSVFSGAAVAAATAVHGSSTAAIGLGVLTTLGAGLFLRMSTTTSHKRERQVDRTFIPDLSIKTLHRLLPSLIDRLQDAGLAPVFIVDELDKVNDLERRIYPLIRNLKKLFAERSCTCLLVDRGFYENLVIREDLEQLPSAPPGPNAAAGGAARTFVGPPKPAAPPAAGVPDAAQP